MILYSDKDDHYSHRVRIVLGEKDISCEIRETTNEEAPEEVLSINPYHTLPIMVDRELGLYDSNIMLEYLDERFPHPPLLPVYPVARANARMFLHRIENEWTPLIRTIETAKRNNKRSPSAAKELKEQLVAVAPIFEEMPYFMSEEFSLVDCTVAPILWRLPHLGVELPPKQTRGLQDYQYRMFNRDAFQASLSEAEREMPRS